MLHEFNRLLWFEAFGAAAVACESIKGELQHELQNETKNEEKNTQTKHIF